MLVHRSSSNSSSLDSAFEHVSSLLWSNSLAEEDDVQRQPRGGTIELVSPQGQVGGTYGSLEEHFELLPGNMLGSGGSGSQVFEAECRLSGRRVAVKSYDKEALEAMGWPSARDETDILAELDHPGIVRLEGFFESATKAHVVMERLGGGELFDWVKHLGPMPEAMAGSVATQVLKAVAHIHAKGIIHRDLKLENLMVSSLGPAAPTVKIIDFGLAAKLEPRGPRKLSQRCGTLEWAAPEVVSGQPYDEKADLWSAGASFYALLTGRPLYSGDRLEIVRKSTEGAVDFHHQRFTRLSEGAQNFLQSLLLVEPARRASASEALRHDWLLHANTTNSNLGGRVSPVVAAGADQIRQQSRKGSWDALGSADRSQCNRSLASLPETSAAKGFFVSKCQCMGSEVEDQVSLRALVNNCRGCL